MKAWLALGISALLCLALYIGLNTYSDLSASAPLATPSLYIRDCAPSRTICSVQVGSVTLRIQLQPQGLPAMVPMTLRVDVESLANVQMVRAWFEGRDMDMGRHELAPLPGNDTTAIMWGGVIPVCSVNPQMMWQLKLLLQVQGKQQQIVFDLATDAMTE